MKDKLFSKIVKKDYNNDLEKVLSKKDFSEEVKSTLLSMFYKIENGYNDYNKVKRNTYDKKHYIEKLIDTIDKDCEKIEFSKDEKIDIDKKEIICKPIELNLLNSISKIKKKNIVVTYLDESIEEAFSDFLNTGNNINNIEPLRDFTGFSWNIIVKEIENINYNLMYQNMIFLLGNEFMDKWVNNYDSSIDYLSIFRDKIEKKYGKKIQKKIFDSLIKLSLMIKMKENEDFLKKIKNKKKSIEQEFYDLENREMYLIKISKCKKKREKEIRVLDLIINNKKLLEEEYEIRNEKLPLNKKIFSIRVLKEKLIEEKNELLKQIAEFNKMMNPREFLGRRYLIEQKLNYIGAIDENQIEEQINQEMINLQKEIISCMKTNVKKTQSKDTIIDMLYKYRYYNYLPVGKKKDIGALEELQEDLDEFVELLINKAIEMKVLTKIIKDEERNYDITKELLLSKIISLEDIALKAEENPNLILQIYDEQIEDGIIYLENMAKEDIKIKINKKTKLFI